MKDSKFHIQSDITTTVRFQLTNFSPLNHIYIGYSGGVDSHVLLHICASLPEFKSKITAVYIHHGLQKEAHDWAIHCQKIAANLDVSFLELRVNAHQNQGESPEESARNARYSAFKTLINKNDVLLVAQHREDQLETVLLQLFRGSGLQGLSGMPEKMPFSEGDLLRPLLNISKEAINVYAEKNHLNWIEDPSNQSTVYDRNFLRQEIIPQLKQRWQSLDKTVARTATHCAETQMLLSKMTQAKFATVFNADDETLNIPTLQTYSQIEQRLILRQWFAQLRLKMPSQDFVQRILNEVITARVDRSPILNTQGVIIRRYRATLYAITHVLTGFDSCHWEHKKMVLTLSNQQRLTLKLANSGIDQSIWNHAVITVKMRHGGEKIRLPNRHGHHDLKKLFQEKNIPPWQREIIPLIYLDNKLAAVGDVWIAAEFYTEQINSCVQISL